MKKSFLSVVVLAVASTASFALDQAPPVGSVQMRAVRTQTVLVNECTTDSFGRQTCRVVPCTEMVYAPVSVATVVSTPVQAPPVATMVVNAATVVGDVSASLAFPRMHGIRQWFKDRPKLFQGRLAKRLRGESNCE